MQAPVQITFVKHPNDHHADLSDLGGRLTSAREEAGLSQDQLAAKAGVSQGTIGNIESRQRKNPRELLAIAKAVGVHAEWLKSGKGPRRLAEESSPPTESVELSNTDWDMLHAFQELPEAERVLLAQETMERAQKYRAFAEEVLKRHTANHTPVMPDIKPAPRPLERNIQRAVKQKDQTHPTVKKR